MWDFLPFCFYFGAILCTLNKNHCRDTETSLSSSSLQSILHHPCPCHRRRWWHCSRGGRWCTSRSGSSLYPVVLGSSWLLCKTGNKMKWKALPHAQCIQEHIGLTPKARGFEPFGLPTLQGSGMHLLGAKPHCSLPVCVPQGRWASSRRRPKVLRLLSSAAMLLGV